jgi:shikimate dehydrogenase
MLITGRARLAGVLGFPVGHSLSPRLHGYWLERYAIDGAYVPLAVAPADLELAFRALPKLGFLGWNVTLPHKEAACRLVDELDGSAIRAGVVNTIRVDAAGRTRGYSTDGYGFLANLRAEVAGWRAGEGPVVLVGTGGASRAVAQALLEAGCTRLRLTNRTRARAEKLAADLRGQGGNPKIEVWSWQARHDALAGASLCVNCSSLGMTGQPPLELDLGALPLQSPVVDLVYVPLETGLLAAARQRGHPVVDGLGMLIWQAVPGFSYWGGVEPAVDEATRRVLLEALAPTRPDGARPLER